MQAAEHFGATTMRDGSMQSTVRLLPFDGHAYGVFAFVESVLLVNETQSNERRNLTQLLMINPMVRSVAAELITAQDRAGLETFGLVHEHKCGYIFTSHVRWQKLPKKKALRPVGGGGAHHHGRDACRLRGGRQSCCSCVVDRHHDRRGERRSSFPSFPVTFPTMCPNANR